MTQPFLIFALPRSMTAWTSCFLTIGNVYCQHEMPVETEQIVSFMQNSPFEFTGICDPGLLLRWRELTDALPNAKLIYIRRPSHQSLKSLAKAGAVDPKLMTPGFDRLNECASEFIQAREPLIIDWKKLQTPEGACELWQTVTGNNTAPASHVIKMLTLHIEQNPELIKQTCGNSGATTKN
jgi:hypothetical protein